MNKWLPYYPTNHSFSQAIYMILHDDVISNVHSTSYGSLGLLNQVFPLHYNVTSNVLDLKPTSPH